MTPQEFAVKMASSQLRDTPYTMAVEVDLSTTDYSVPSDFQVNEIRCVTAGAIKIDTTRSTGVTIHLGAFDLLPIVITKIYKTGTDAALVTGNIVVYGFSIINDLTVQ